MANMLKMMQKAMAMRREVKKLQRELESQTVDFTSGGVRVVARGDMSVANISIDPSLVDPSRITKLESAVASAVNGALSAARKKVEEVVSKQSGGDLADLLRSGL